MSNRMTVMGAALLALLSCAGIAAPGSPEMKLTNFVDTMALGGDLRLRHESIMYSRTFQGAGVNAVDRQRERLRLRIKMDWTLPNGLMARTQLATGMAQNALSSGMVGQGEPVSTNLSYTNLSTSFPIMVDQAYLSYIPISEVTLLGGRMANPMWMLYSSNAVWDADFNPEGYAQKVDVLLFDEIRVFVNALQMVVDEDSTTNMDQWMFGEQVGVEFRLPLDLRVRVAGSYNDWTRARNSSFKTNTAQEGNVRTGADSSSTGFSDGKRVQDFAVAAADVEIAGWALNVPFSVQGTYVNNTRFASVRSRSSYQRGPEQWGGQAGLVVGKASADNSVEVGYFYKYMKYECTVADVADSDFGDKGGLNRKGNIVWLAYNPVEYAQLKMTYFFNTRMINPDLVKSPNGKYLGRDVNRLQVDLTVKF